MGAQLVLITCARSLIRTPPNVNVMPPVTGQAVRRAQACGSGTQHGHVGGQHGVSSSHDP